MTARTRAAVVTGSAGGIGAGISDSLLRAGWNVLATDIDEQALAGFAAARTEHASRLRTLPVDVSSEQDWSAVVTEADRWVGGVDALVNNAAISPKHDGAKLVTADIPSEEWDRVIGINLTGAFYGLRAVLEPMREREWGRVVNLSSQAAHTGARVAGAHYGATKAALLGLTRTVAHEYGPFGITANAITPGRIETPMAAGVSDEVNETWRRAIPVGRLGQPADIGAMAAFLLSEEASFVNGATLDVNGGSRMG